MKNEKFFLVCGIILLILLCGCTGLPGQNLPGNDQNTPTDQNIPFDQNAPIDQNIPFDQNAPTDQNIPFDQNAPTDQNIPVITTVDVCNAKPNQIQKDLCFRSLAALSKENLSFCDKLLTLSKDDCIYRAAVALKDKDICGPISDKNILGNCYAVVARDTNNYQTCLNITQEPARSNCLYSTGKASNTVESCKQIADNTHEFILFRDDCIKSVGISTLDETVCSFISNSYISPEANRDACYYAVAQSKKKKTICPKIFDKNISNDCYDIAARNDYNALVCLNITDMNKMVPCIKFIADVNTNAETCLLIPDKNEADTCKNNMLTDLNTFSVCSSFADAAQRENCYYNFSVNFDANLCKQALLDGNSNNCVAGCEKISIDINKADDCFGAIAIKLVDVSYCNRARTSNVYVRNNCFETIARATFDANLCNNIFNRAENYSRCFANIAVDANDFTVCDLAKKDFPWEDHTSKNWCYFYFASILHSIDDCNRIKEPDLVIDCRADINGSS